MLFDQVEVAEILQLRMQAAKALGASGSAFGVFGAPSLALAAEAAALSVVTGVLAAAAHKSALEKLNEASTRSETLRKKGVWIDVNEIKNLEFPSPEAWFGFEGFRRQSVDIGHMNKQERKNYLKEHGEEYFWGMGSKIAIKLPAKHVHSGDDFIHVQTEKGSTYFRWSQVSAYEAP